MANQSHRRQQDPSLPPGYAWASDLIREEQERQLAAQEHSEKTPERDQNSTAANQATINATTARQQSSDEDLRAALLQFQAVEQLRKQQQPPAPVMPSSPKPGSLQIAAQAYAQHQMQQYQEAQAQMQHSPGPPGLSGQRDPRNWGSAHWYNRSHARKQREEQEQEQQEREHQEPQNQSSSNW